jgi:peptidoglycan/LPS O-acetylase OafA/YrhL
MDSLQRNRRFAISIGFVSLMLYYYVWFNDAKLPFVPDAIWPLFSAALRPVIAWGWVLGFIGYGKQYLNRSHRILNYLNQAVYPFYILHQTVIVILAYYITRSAGDTVIMKYIFTVVVTLFITMGIFHFFVKPYPVIRFLFGMKPSNGVKKKVAVANKVLTVKEPLTEVAI